MTIVTIINHCHIQKFVAGNHVRVGWGNPLLVKNVLEVVHKLHTPKILNFNLTPLTSAEMYEKICKLLGAAHLILNVILTLIKTEDGC